MLARRSSSRRPRVRNFPLIGSCGGVLRVCRKAAGPRSPSSSSSVSSRTPSRTRTRKTLISRTSSSRTSSSSRRPCVYWLDVSNPSSYRLLCPRKPAVARTVHTVVSTPTRVTRATLKSSSPRLTPRSSVPRTRTSSLPHHSPASTGGRLPADVLRLLVRLPREHVCCLLCYRWCGRVGGGVMPSACDAGLASLFFICMRMPCR